MRVFIVLLVFSSLTISILAYGIESVPQIKRGTEFDFDELPLGLKLSQAFAKYLSPSKAQGIFSEEELESMANALSSNPKRKRTLQIVDDVCAEYALSSKLDVDLNLSWVGSQLALAELYDEQDRYQAYIDVFEKLSPVSRATIEYEMGTMRGTRQIGSSITDWSQLFSENPDTGMLMLRRMCKRLPQAKHSLENQPETKSFDNVVPIYIDK